MFNSAQFFGDYGGGRSRVESRIDSADCCRRGELESQVRAVLRMQVIVYFLVFIERERGFI
jgi:hypothetical protein